MGVELDDAALKHVVHFYEHDAELVSVAGRFLADGLSRGEVALIVAVPEHRWAFAAELSAWGVDVESARLSGHYLEADAQEALESFMYGVRPDPARFHTCIGSLIATAAAGGRSVRAYGEMVGVLWAAHNPEGALELEALWEQLSSQHEFSLCCGYPMTAVAGRRDLGMTKAVCDAHSTVLTPASYTPDVLTTSPWSTGATTALFLPVALAPSAARRFVVETLGSRVPGDPAESAAVIATELATNALRHAKSPFRVSITTAESTTRIEVQDASPIAPVRAETSLRSSDGRGIKIVEALCQRWGTEPLADGKIVWAEIKRPS